MKTEDPRTALTAHLESAIAAGALAPGEKLPTQRELGAQFGLAQSAVCRVLKRLEARGLLELRQGSGCFVRTRAEKRGRYNLMVYTQGEVRAASYCGRILLGMQERAAELGIGLMLNFVRYEHFADTPLREREKEFDAVVLVGLYDTALTNFSSRKPCVGVDMHRSFGCLSTLEMDPVEAAELAAGYLRRRHVRNVLCFSPVLGKNTPTVLDFRLQCFLAAWDGKSRVLSPDKSADLSFLARLPKDTGLWFANDSYAQDVLRACGAQTGRDLVAELPVISNNGRNRLDPRMLRCPTITPDYRAMGRCAVDEAVRRIAGPGAPRLRIYQSVTLLE